MRLLVAPRRPTRATVVGALHSAKGLPWHRERLAVVYVRQSTAQQVLEHQESTRLQYGLVERARALGWAADRVLVIDEDLGRSAASSAERAGFQRLVSEVSLDHVGLILGLEMSRLARSSRDWHQLLELCALPARRWGLKPSVNRLLRPGDPPVLAVGLLCVRVLLAGVVHDGARRLPTRGRPAHTCRSHPSADEPAKKEAAHGCATIRGGYSLT
jgi:hypothetical protein